MSKRRPTAAQAFRNTDPSDFPRLNGREPLTTRQGEVVTDDKGVPLYAPPDSGQPPVYHPAHNPTRVPSPSSLAAATLSEQLGHLANSVDDSKEDSSAKEPVGDPA